MTDKIEVPKRDIFGPYWNGENFVYGDPMELRRKLRGALGPDQKAVLEDYNSPAPELSEPAADRLHGAVVKAFDLKPFDKFTSTGCTEELIVKVWNEFQRWVKKKQPNTEPTPNLSECSASQRGQQSMGPSPTPPIAGSPSISPGSG